MNIDDIDNRFAYHAPRDEETKDAHAFIRNLLRDTASKINDCPVLPEGREKSLVMTHLEEAMMWANAGIARRS